MSEFHPKKESSIIFYLDKLLSVYFLRLVQCYFILISLMLIHRRKDLALQLITFPKIFEDSSFILYPGLSECLPVSDRLSV